MKKFIILFHLYYHFDFVSYILIGNKIYEFDGYNKLPNMFED